VRAWGTVVSGACSEVCCCAAGSNTVTDPA
jgi:hypothetical protein